MDQTSRWYDLQFLRYRVWQTEIGNYGWFLPFYPHPPKHPKNQNFEKIKKKLLEVSSFYKCEPKTSHVRYGSWETESDRQNFLSFWAICCPFTPLLTPNIKIWKKCKKNLEILSFYTCVPQMKIISCMVWFLRYKGMRGSVFCHFGPSFAPSDPPNNWKNQNFEKIKKSLEILSFYTCVPKMTIIWCMVPEIWSVAAIFVSFWTIFWPFTPLTQKIKILKKRNKHLEVSLFYTSVP